MPQLALAPPLSSGLAVLGVPIAQSRLPVTTGYRVHDRGLFMMDAFWKRSEDVLDYFIDMWRWLEPGETVEGARAWAEPGALDVVKVEFADTGVLVWCANGCDGARSVVHCRIITSIGREKLFRFRIDTRGRPGNAIIIGGGSTVTVGGSDPLTITPPSLSFANTNIGAQSAAQVVTITNNSSVVLPIASIAVSGDFAQTNSVGVSLAPGASATISVRFAPTGASGGPRTGQLSVVTPFGTDAVPLGGTAVAVGHLSLTPLSLAMGSVEIGDTGAAQTVTVANDGSAPVSIMSIAATGDFLQTNDAGASLAPGAQFSISVSFAPTVAGAGTGSLAITTDLGLTSVPLSGTGVTLPTAAIADATIAAAGPLSTLSAASLGFPNTNVGASSATQTFTITNDGVSALTIASVVSSGAFAQTNDYTAPLAPGAHCTVTVHFAPTVAGGASGNITVTSDGSSTPQTVTLSGAGVVVTTGPVASVSVSTLSFPDTSV